MSGSSDMRSTVNHEYMKMFGDVTPGEYSEDGRLLKAGIVTNPEMQEKLANMYAISAARMGGEMLPDQKKRAGKAKKVPKRNIIARNDDPGPLDLVAIQKEVDTEQTVKLAKIIPTQKLAVYLHNKMGKIKMQVETVLDSTMAYCLVFANDDDVIFTPNAGETLNFTDQHGETTAVYYTDTLFSWIDGQKKLMILFKTNDDTN